MAATYSWFRSSLGNIDTSGGGGSGSMSVTLAEGQSCQRIIVRANLTALLTYSAGTSTETWNPAPYMCQWSLSVPFAPSTLAQGNDVMLSSVDSGSNGIETIWLFKWYLVGGPWYYDIRSRWRATGTTDAVKFEVTLTDLYSGGPFQRPASFTGSGQMLVLSSST